MFVIVYSCALNNELVLFPVYCLISKTVSLNSLEFMHAVTDTISLRELTFFDTLAQMKKIIAGQKKCKNSITGCGWIGDPSEVESHLKSCDYVLQNCTNIGCNFKVLRKDMTEHTRRVCDLSLIHI